MRRAGVAYLLVLLLVGAAALAQSPGKLDLLYADETEFIFSRLQDTTFVSGSVVFETETGMIYCDSAMWAKGELVILWGKVVVDDRDYRIVADSVHYDLIRRQADALGDYVELWSRPDSLFAVGTQAFVDRGRRYFHMVERPTVYLNYPDSSRMIEIVSDFVAYDAERRVAEAEGSVVISSEQFTAAAGCAVMYPGGNRLDLFDSPVVRRKKSEISGRFITVESGSRFVRRVDVLDSAYAEFIEPKDGAQTIVDRSILSGERIVMDFTAGDLREVNSYGQAYSWYYPAPTGNEEVENSVSGDTIRFTVANEQLLQVDVLGGAVGTYLGSKLIMPDSADLVDSLGQPLDSIPGPARQTDTVDYQARHIAYSLIDSLITLKKSAQTTSGAVALEAHQIEFDTRDRLIEAFSAALAADSAKVDSTRFDLELQPNDIPVVLRDKDQNLVGDYLEYSIDTEKGRIVTSKSQYQTGYFYGEKLHRQQKDIFYLEDGIYTTCDAEEPHFHFKAKNLKLIDGQKLIARPVVLHLGRLPLLAVPYYVFPLEKGRHSGLLPFTLGNIERGERYIRNVGYYWAASEYWDWQGALDYFEDRDRLNLYSRLNYRKRYAFDGYISGNWGRETNLDNSTVNEFKQSRWTLKAVHNHEVTPSFRYSATGDVRSDASYYNDYSTNLEDRLNRIIRSQVNFSKKFGAQTSLSGTLSHDDYLDTESRIDRLPSLSLSLPSVRPFGSGGRNEAGEVERHWYNELIVTYRPRLENYSSRNTVDSMANIQYDTTFTFDTTITIIDSLTMQADTSITALDTIPFLVSQDTLSYRSRKEYTRVDHALSASFPLTVARYFVFNPRFNYSENWMKVHPTDQSELAGIDASNTYRTYKYNAQASLSTKLYGTIYPNLFGLSGLRQVITPSVIYSYDPKSDPEPVVSSFAGGTARSSSLSQSMSLTLNHVYQAKVRRGEEDKNYELVSVTHGLRYNFEAEGRKYSNLTTSIRSNLLRNIRLNANMVHSLYESPTSEVVDLWKPHLTSFDINATLSLHGARFIFDEANQRIRPGADTSGQGGASSPGGPSRKGWDLSATYNFSETGKWGGTYRKTASIQFSLKFNLTATTQVNYSQYYDFVGKKTITNSVNIIKKIHCWTGTFHWVPTGSTRGWGFRLFVTELPAVKIDNSQSSLNSSYFQNEFR